MNEPVIVLGLGNPLMSDEGIGVRIVHELSQKADDYPDVKFHDAGTGGMSILHAIAHREKAIIVDCALMGTESGTIKRFEPHQVESVKKLTHHSLHEADILRILELAKQLDQCPRDVIIFGIEPVTIKPGQIISPNLAAKLDFYIKTIEKELS